MAGYLPSANDEFLQWLMHFASAIGACGAEAGVSAEEIAKIQADAARFEAEMHGVIAANNAYRAALAMRDEDRKGDIEPYLRQLVKRIQTNPNVTDVIRCDLGITVPGKHKTPPDWDALEAAGEPLLLVEFGLAKRAILKFGKNPHNAHQNALPKGIRGVRIWQYIGDGPPERDEDWRFLDECRRSPYTHVLMNARPLTITYRVAYVDRQNRAGLPSEPVTVTINP